jgi:glycosyltransferase involved in cell wall biosynthesis
MAKYSVRMVSTFPTKGEGISKYTNYLNEELLSRTIAVNPTRIYFLEKKLSTVQWLRLLFIREDILHVQYTPTGSGPLILIYALLRSRKKKFIITSHEFPSTYGKHLPKALRGIYYGFERILHNAADIVAVHTGLQRDELLSIGVKPEKVMVVPFPVYPVFAVRKAEIPDVKHGIFFGRITPKKGIEVLLDAVKYLPKDMTFTIAGSPAIGYESYAQTLPTLVKSMGLESRIVFTGYLEDVALSKLMYGSGFAVLPYIYVTHSAVLMTMIGHGIPYVASDLPAFREIYNHYKGGLLFETGNGRGLAEGIMLCQDTRLRMRFAAEGQRAREQNNWKTYADRMVEYYEN